MIKKAKTISIIIFLFFLVCLFFYYRGIDAPADKKGEDKMFVISSGETVKQIGSNLSAAGLIKSKFYFEVYVWRSKKGAELQAGEYTLSPKLSIREIVKIVSRGETMDKEKTIKIIEGWNIKDIRNYLEKENAQVAEDFYSLAGKNPATNKDWNIPGLEEMPDFLKDLPAEAGLEGFLFPDTYRIYKNAEAGDIVVKMLKNFDGKLTEQMRSDIEKQGRSIYEIVTMASIVEKEVRTAEDMKIVSGIFWDRIKNGQALESCATLAYILGVNKPQYTIEDTKTESPYNTYKYSGLPPTPVCNPGLNALKAAIYPEYTDYNYFLSRPDTGETVFSKTYDEHLRNKNKYLK